MTAMVVGSTAWLGSVLFRRPWMLEAARLELVRVFIVWIILVRTSSFFRSLSDLQQADGFWFGIISTGSRRLPAWLYIIPAVSRRSIAWV